MSTVIIQSRPHLRYSRHLSKFCGKLLCVSAAAFIVVVITNVFAGALLPAPVKESVVFETLNHAIVCLTCIATIMLLVFGGFNCLIDTAYGRTIVDFHRKSHLLQAVLALAIIIALVAIQVRDAYSYADSFTQMVRLADYNNFHTSLSYTIFSAFVGLTVGYLIGVGCFMIWLITAWSADWQAWQNFRSSPTYANWCRTANHPQQQADGQSDTAIDPPKSFRDFCRTFE